MVFFFFFFDFAAFGFSSTGHNESIDFVSSLAINVPVWHNQPRNSGVAPWTPVEVLTAVAFVPPYCLLRAYGMLTSRCGTLFLLSRVLTASMAHVRGEDRCHDMRRQTLGVSDLHTITACCTIHVRVIHLNGIGAHRRMHVDLSQLGGSTFSLDPTSRRDSSPMRFARQCMHAYQRTPSPTATAGHGSS